MDKPRILIFSTAYAPLIGAMRVLDESPEAAVEIEPSQITDQRGA